MYVYVMSAANETASKIGISKSPKTRVSEVRVGNHSGAKLWRAFPCQKGDAVTLERRAHGLLAAYRTSGEWFAVHPDVAATFVKSIVTGVPTIDKAVQFLKHSKAATEPGADTWQFCSIVHDKDIVMADEYAWPSPY